MLNTPDSWRYDARRYQSIEMRNAYPQCAGNVCFKYWFHGSSGLVRCPAMVCRGFVWWRTMARRANHKDLCGDAGISAPESPHWSAPFASCRYALEGMRPRLTPYSARCAGNATITSLFLLYRLIKMINLIKCDLVKLSTAGAACGVTDVMRAPQMS